MIYVDWLYNYYICLWDFLVVGFYYLGIGDFVKCFKCGIMLYNWEFSDIFWGEYQKWFMQCFLVLEYLSECFQVFILSILVEYVV